MSNFACSIVVPSISLAMWIIGCYGPIEPHPCNLFWKQFSNQREIAKSICNDPVSYPRLLLISLLICLTVWPNFLELLSIGPLESNCYLRRVRNRSCRVVSVMLSALRANNLCCSIFRVPIVLFVAIFICDSM